MYRICFVDDDEQFEIPLFQRVFGQFFDIIAAADYADLKSQIDGREGWAPDLFVLDLYFPSGPASRQAVEALKAEPLSLEDDKAEIRAAYANHVRAAERLRSVLDAWKQGPDGGLALAAQVAADYPTVPIVFYSRKATLEDAIRCMAAKNVSWVVRKPTGKDSAETIELTMSAKQRIAEQFNVAVLKTNSEKVKRSKEAAHILLDLLDDLNR